MLSTSTAARLLTLLVEQSVLGKQKPTEKTEDKIMIKDAETKARTIFSNLTTCLHSTLGHFINLIIYQSYDIKTLINAKNNNYIGEKSNAPPI